MKIKYLIAIILSLLLLGGTFYYVKTFIYPGSTNFNDVLDRTEPILKKALSEKGLQYGDPILIRIFKESKELEVWIKNFDRKYILFKTYPICSYSGELGPKQKEGDKQSPEGFYTVSSEQMNKKSAYHLSFNLGFPNEYDLLHKRTGSFLMIHGACISAGCYAMTNGGIEEIYLLAHKALENGQNSFQVHAFPFQMTQKNMQKYKSSKWYPFWKNLKEGYDYFEQYKRAPNIVIQNQDYTFQ